MQSNKRKQQHYTKHNYSADVKRICLNTVGKRKETKTDEKQSVTSFAENVVITSIKKAEYD